MTVVAEAEEAALVAEDVADLVTLAHQRPDDSALEAVVAQLLRRHHNSGVKISTAAKVLDISTTTVNSWLTRGLLDPVGGAGVRRVSSVSLGKTLALTRLIDKDGGPDRRQRILRTLEQLRDRDLLERARRAAEATEEGEVLRYDAAALEELRNL